MKIIKLGTTLLIVLCFTNILNAQITIYGDAFLENETNHSTIKIVFERIAPSSYSDSIYSSINGHFTLIIPEGIYNIYYSRSGFLPDAIESIALYTSTTLSDITLEYYDLSGSLSGTLSQGTYRVGKDIQVNGGAGLTIEPGVNLLFMKDVEFHIYGLLNAQGDSNNRIVFKSYKGSVSWGGIKFHNSANDGGILSYCTVEQSICSGITIDSVNLTLSNLLIWKNYGDCNGAGIRINHSDVVLNNVEIINNGTADEPSNGGGIFCRNGNVIINNSILNYNKCRNNAAGIFFQSGDNLIINNTSIANNGTGGGISFDGSDNLFITNCRIINNTSNHKVGGIYFKASDSLKIINSLIANNVNSYSNYGAIYLDYSSHKSPEFILINTSIVNNTGAGIRFNDNASLRMINSIVANNKSYGIYYNQSNAPNLDVNYCNFINNSPYNFYYNSKDWLLVNVTTNDNGDSCDAWKNIQEDPRFVDIDYLDYRIMQGSPCIDAGMNDSVSIFTDLAGNQRIIDGDINGTAIVDIGAFEFDTSFLLPFYSLSGKVKTSDSLLSNGIIQIFEAAGDPNIPIETVSIRNDSFYFDHVIRGDYKVYVLPAGVYSNVYHPTYFVNTRYWHYAIPINVYKDIKGVVVSLVEKDVATDLVRGLTVSMIIYPNPVKREINLEMEFGSTVHASISLYNIFGQEVAGINESYYSQGEHKISFDVSALNEGIYLLRIGTDKGILTKKIVVKR